MASNLEITPKVIVLGSRVIQLRQVVQAQIGQVAPFRVVGRILILLGVLILIGAAAGHQLELTTSAGAIGLVGLFVLGLGLLAAFSSRDTLLITTSDGAKIQVAHRNGQFLKDVLDRIRDAMSAPPESVAHFFVVDVENQRIEQRTYVPGAGQASHPPAHTGHGIEEEGPTAPAGGAMHDRSAGPRARPSRGAATANGTALAAQPATNGYPNGTEGGAHLPHLAKADPFGKPISAAPARFDDLSAGGVAEVETRPLARRRAAPASDEGGLRTATATATREPLPRPQTASSDAAVSAAIEELDLLAEALRNGGAPHIDQLMRLIDVLRRQLSANPPKMSEANQGWAQFADYATKYLSNIAGVMARVESIGRILGR